MYRLGSTIGCLWALAYASTAVGDIPSVRIILPIDMKNLHMSILQLESLAKRRSDHTQRLRLIPAYIVIKFALDHWGQRHSL